MKKRYSIIFAAALALAAVACTKYVYVYSVGELDNPIQLVVGVFGTSSTQTKAVEPGAQHDHEDHRGFATGNEIRLRVDGTWTGHDPELVSQTTVATLAEQSGNHNSVASYAPVLYWDDYGTADPANASTGRAQGLTIYGVAVNDKDADVPVVDGTSGKQWTALAWTLPADQHTSWDANDLLISNNVKGDNTYKFINISGGKLLEFTHAMSKVTVEVRPGGGFDGNFSAAPTIAFQIPFKMSGSVDIETGDVTPGSTQTPGSNIKLKYGDAPTASPYIHSYDGIVMPGNEVPGGVNLLTVSADGNDYIITTEKLRAAMMKDTESAQDAGDGNYLFHSGKNYIIQISLGKTALNVTVTIVDWEDVTADMVNPSINVSAGVGDTSQGHVPASTTSFSFFDRVNGNNDDAYGTVVAGEHPYYNPDAVLTYNPEVAETSRWTLAPLLYWPDHNTHLHMRGVYPEVGTSAQAATKPVVTGTTFQDQSIAVFNTAYEAASYPSDLMLGKPLVSDDQLCPANTVSPHNHTPILVKDNGICATTGKINLTFKYMMSQVEVRLKTAPNISHDPGAIAPDAVDLTGAEVSIVGIMNSGSVSLETLQVSTSGDRGDYLLDPVDPSGGPRGTFGIPAANIRQSAIIPQSLVYDTKNVRIKVQLKNGDQNAAAYYVENLPNLLNNQVAVTPDKRWEPGRHYIYTLDIRKTGIEVSATIVDWVQADAESNVWM